MTSLAEAPLAAPAKPLERFAHVILTRFNVRYVEDPAAPSIGTDPAWLAERFSLFERYCLPTILAQKEQAFSWLLFFDASTPEPLAERARALASIRAGLHPVFCESLPLNRVREAVREILPQPPPWLLTTRLDNDDGLHVDFVATVQAAQRFDRAEVLNCPEGIILHRDRAYRRRDRSNAFISLSEPFAEARTVFGIARHVYASESYPLRQVATSPLWLQVIHDGNISNRVRGRRTPLIRAAAGFAPLVDLPPSRVADSGASILTENVGLYPLRSLRDLAVTGVRRAARIFGVDLRRKAAQPRDKAGARPWGQ